MKNKLLEMIQRKKILYQINLGNPRSYRVSKLITTFLKMLKMKVNGLIN